MLGKNAVGCGELFAGGTARAQNFSVAVLRSAWSRE